MTPLRALILDPSSPVAPTEPGERNLSVAADGIRPMTTRSEHLRALHVPGRPLWLANAWDVGSARIVAAAGAAAIATTSAGVAWSLGYPDGDRLDREAALDLIRRVAAAVDLPVTAD